MFAKAMWILYTFSKLQAGKEHAMCDYIIAKLRLFTGGVYPDCIE